MFLDINAIIDFFSFKELCILLKIAVKHIGELLTKCKLLQCEELHKRLDCKTMENEWYIYMKYGPKGCQRS